MSKIDCDIINDLMPLYAEEIVSNASKKLVEEHIAECPDCMKKYKQMKKEIEIPVDNMIAPMESLKKKLNHKKIQTILLAITLSIAVMIIALIYVTAPIYMDYDHNLISIKKCDDGSILATISGDVDGYSFSGDTDDMSNIDITTWNSLWNKYIKKGQERSFIMNKNGEGGFYNVKSIYYYSGNTNNGTIKSKDLLIYGNDLYTTSGGQVSLPRIVLSYYFVIAFMIALVSGVVCIFNKKHIKLYKASQIISMVAISYLISQLCVKGVRFSSYSLMKDLSGIMLLMIPIFLILVITRRLIQGSKVTK